MSLYLGPNLLYESVPLDSAKCNYDVCETCYCPSQRVRVLTTEFVHSDEIRSTLFYRGVALISCAAHISPAACIFILARNVHARLRIYKHT
jgi:hypothetical protein